MFIDAVFIIATCWLWWLHNAPVNTEIKRVIGYLNGGGQSHIAFVNTESRSAETKRITTKQISIEARCRKPPLLKLGQFWWLLTAVSILNTLLNVSTMCESSKVYNYVGNFIYTRYQPPVTYRCSTTLVLKICYWSCSMVF